MGSHGVGLPVEWVDRMYHEDGYYPVIHMRADGRGSVA